MKRFSGRILRASRYYRVLICRLKDEPLDRLIHDEELIDLEKGSNLFLTRRASQVVYISSRMGSNLPKPVSGAKLPQGACFFLTHQQHPLSPRNLHSSGLLAAVGYLEAQLLEGPYAYWH